MAAGACAQAATLGGTLAFLDGTPIAGAPIEVQLRTVSMRGEVVTEQTVVQAVTGAGGEWSVPVDIVPSGREGIWLRALSPGGAIAPAAVSVPLHLPAAASITPQSAPAPTPQAPAPPAA